MYQLKPPLKVKCSECKKTIIVKFCPPRQEYSQKNNWGYWTNQEKLKHKYICDGCLRDLYHQRKWDYLATITDSKKRRMLRSYFYSGIVRN